MLLAGTLAACTAAGAAARSPTGAPAATGGAGAAPCPGATLRPSATDAAAVDAAVLCLVDAVRQAHRLAPLRANPELGSVAGGQVVAMLRGDYFADVRPSGQTPLSLVFVTRYPAHASTVSVAQNIAWGTGLDTTPARIVDAWLASPAHRRIILTGEYRDAGVAVAPELPRVVGRHGATYVMEFGARRLQTRAR